MRSRQHLASDLQRANAVKARLPHCGAKCRDGTRCRNPGAGAGGKCPKHGGLTPSGDRWHVPVLPPDGPRLERKLATLAKRRKKREAEIRAMTPERRERYEAWHRVRKPGSASRREQARQDRDAKALFGAPRRDSAADPVAAALQADLAAVRAEKARLEALLAAPVSNDGERDG